MNEPRLPSVHIIKVEGDYASVVTSPICDFCGDIGPKWDYGCADFEIPELPSPWGGSHWASADGWAICGPCSELIDKRLGADLMVRMLHGGTTGVKAAGLVMQGFFDNMTGEKTPFG